MNAESPNIARIFGTNTNAFELLVMKRRIMGPCWLQIKNPQIDNKGVSDIFDLALIYIQNHLGLMVQTRGNSLRPEGYKYIPGNRNGCAEGDASAHSYELERSYHRKPPGE